MSIQIKSILMLMTAFLIGCTSEYDDYEKINIQNQNEYIDIDPISVENRTIYSGNSIELNTYLAAFSRFHQNVKPINGILTYEGPINQKLKISERLFVFLKQGLDRTNNDIQQEKVILIEKENGDFDLISPLALKSNHLRMKTRSAEGWDDYKPGSLDGKDSDRGMTVLNGMKQFMHNVEAGVGYGKIGDYVDLYSYNWSQSNSSVSGYFNYGGVECRYAVVNLNAGMNNTPRYNDLCSSDTYKSGDTYYIEVTACYQSTPAMVISTRDYDTYKKIHKYVNI